MVLSSRSIDFSLWLTGCEQHWRFYGRQCHDIFSCDQQQVCDVAPFVKGRTITSFPMTNREWVTLHILWNMVSSHLFLWQTACEWHLWKAVSWHIFLWPTESECHCTFLWMTVSPNVSPWPTGSKWHCTFCEGQSHHVFSYDQQIVSDVAHFVEGSLITCFLITIRQWVTFSHFVKGSLISHDIHFSHGQQPQAVSVIAHFVKGSLMISFSYGQQPVSFIAHCCEWQSHDIFFLWPTVSECYDKHALRADAPIPRMFFSPLVLWRYSTYAWLIRTPSFHPSYHSCVNPCFFLAIVLHIYDTLFPCSRYVSSLFTNTERP